jgi:hypothetical protein
VHGRNATVDAKDVQVTGNVKCGVLAFDSGEARLQAGTIVEKNEGKAQVMAGALGSKAGRVLVHKKAAVHGLTIEESDKVVQAY